MAETEDVVGDVRDVVSGGLYGELMAVEESAGKGGEGIGAFVGALMTRNARELSRNFEMLYEGEVAAHDATKKRLEAALDQLDTIRWRAAWLCGDVDTMERPVWQ